MDGKPLAAPAVTALSRRRLTTPPAHAAAARATARRPTDGHHVNAGDTQYWSRRRR